MNKEKICALGSQVRRSPHTTSVPSLFPPTFYFLFSTFFLFFYFLSLFIRMRVRQRERRGSKKEGGLFLAWSIFFSGRTEKERGETVLHELELDFVFFWVQGNRIISQSSRRLSNTLFTHTSIQTPPHAHTHTHAHPLQLGRGHAVAQRRRGKNRKKNPHHDCLLLLPRQRRQRQQHQQQQLPRNSSEWATARTNSND